MYGCAATAVFAVNRLGLNRFVISPAEAAAVVAVEIQLKLGFVADKTAAGVGSARDKAAFTEI